MPDPRDNNRAPPGPRAPAQGAFVWARESKKLAKRYRTEIAAGSSSLLSTVITFPLDSVKSRMQSGDKPAFLECVRNVYRKEGTHGFFRGVAAPLVSVTIVRTISFTIYQRAKYTYDRWIYKATGHSPLVLANQKGARPSALTVLCFGAAGATAGALITSISCPFELTKLNAQLSREMAESNKKNPVSTAADDAIRRSYQEKGTWGTARALVRNRGIAGLYSGFHLHVLRDTIGTAIYFMTYESAKQTLANARGNSPTSPAAVVVAGGLCGLVSWACIYPIDTAKTMYQRSCLETLKRNTVTPKISFFKIANYRGLGVSMLRSCMLNALFFSNFEFVKKRINRLETD
ncbi:mitochondrial carrier domain-containing protein [Cryomyces antarcticus]